MSAKKCQGNMASLAGGDDVFAERMKKMQVMMDSMNDGELDGIVDLSQAFLSKEEEDELKNPKKGKAAKDKANAPVELSAAERSKLRSRVQRIARGAGVVEQDVYMFLDEYKKMAKMIGTLGKSGLMGGLGGGDGMKGMLIIRIQHVETLN
jgi:signal recognition particle GTPase